MIFNLILFKKLISRSFIYFYFSSDFFIGIQIGNTNHINLLTFNRIRRIRIRIRPFVSNRSRFTHRKIRTRIAANIWQILLNNNNNKSIVKLYLYKYKLLYKYIFTLTSKRKLNLLTWLLYLLLYENLKISLYISSSNCIFLSFGSFRISYYYLRNY